MKRGFTLIEILVVVAIIGILTTVIVANLYQARVKAADAAVKDDLNGIRSQAEIYYSLHNDSYGNYSGTTCPSVAGAGSLFSNDSNILGAINHAVNVGSGNSFCSTNGILWAVAIGLKSSGSWCIDSTGFSQLNNGAPNAAIVSNKCI